MVADHQDETSGREQRIASDLQRAYADALLGGDAIGAEAVVREAMEAGLAEGSIDDHIIRPALVLVGDLWEQGRITIADERVATSISIRVLALQREVFRVARRRASHRVLLAAAQGERHVVGLEMAASTILHAGYDGRLLGADLRVAEIGAALAVHRPAVVGLSTASTLTSIHLPAAVEAVRELSPETSIVVGGRGIDAGIAATPGVTVCRHVNDAVGQVDALVRRAPHN